MTMTTTIIISIIWMSHIGWSQMKWEVLIIIVTVAVVVVVTKIHNRGCIASSDVVVVIP